MNLLIEIKRQKDAIELIDLEMKLSEILGVKRAHTVRGGDETLDFPETKDRKGDINPLYEVSGEFNPIDVYHTICSNQYSILKSMVIK